MENKLTVVEVVDHLRKQVDEKKLVDISSGAEEILGVSRPRFSAAVVLLTRNERYEVVRILANQKDPGVKTALKILATPGTSYRDVIENRDKIVRLTAE